MQRLHTHAHTGPPAHPPTHPPARPPAPACTQEACARLLASVAGVAAPGSRLLLDFLHVDALDGSSHYPGFHACAEV